MVDLRRTVQADIQQSQPSARLCGLGHDRRVSDDPRNMILGEDSVRGVAKPCFVPRLAGNGALKPLPKDTKKALGGCMVVTQAGRQLHQQGAKRGTKRSYLTDKSLQRLRRVDEPADVRNFPWHFGREAKS